MNALAAPRILVVEDDLKISNLLLDYLHADGFFTTALHDGREALSEIEKNEPALVILDLNLPGIDGMGICKAVRRFSEVPILLLTARVDEADRLLGLDAGADDYVCKPFAPREVVARVRALLRRSLGRVKLSDVPWTIDDGACRISWREQWLPLTRLEFFMLRLLLSRPGRVFSRAHLMDCVHDRPREISDRAIDTHIKNIRRKIETIEPSCACIVSVYGLGYRVDAPSQ